MKFIFFGYDYMLPSVQRLIADGHELMGIFSFTCDNIFTFNKNTQELASRLNIPFIQTPANDALLESFYDRGIDAFLAAGYKYKIPTRIIENFYPINVHPTYLPQARGLMPIPQIITQNIKSAAGLTAHIMTDEFDKGDILMQEHITLSDQETVESYCAKLSLIAPDMISRLFADLPALWKNATPQNENAASWFTPPTEQDRLLDWNKPVAELDKTARAFGRYGSLAHIHETLIAVYSHEFWKEEHSLEPGEIASILSREIVIAAKDGFFMIKEHEHAQIQP